MTGEHASADGPGLADRLPGAAWGLLVGDALGVPYEFGPPRQQVAWGATGTYGQPPGTWSDDGALMLALLDSLLTAGWDLDDQAQRALGWYRESAYAPGPRFDVGTTTAAALERYEAGTPAEFCGGAGEADNGNGSLMRVLPVALRYRDADDPELVRLAGEASSVTHAHARSRLCCAVYCLAVRDALHGRRPDIARAFAAVEAVAAEPSEREELELLRSYGRRGGTGYVVDCLWSAWEAFEGARDYRDAVELAVRYGHDTDTTAAVAGGLAGAWFGIGSIPAEWLAGMRGREVAEPLVDELARGLER